MRTPSQTVGPFFSFGLCTTPQHELPGGSVRVSGRVFDGDGAPIPDAMLELWNSDAGWGRCATDGEGRFSFLVPEGCGRFELMVFARGLLKPALTRLYVGGGEAVEDPTLAARPDGDGLRFDVHMQGERATAFFRLE
jgi:protocatechuate 3,4-dioxygenase, alpha subunit